MNETSVTDAAGLKTACVGAHVPQALADELEALAKRNFRSTSAEARLAIVKHLADCRGALSAA